LRAQGNSKTIKSPQNWRCAGNYLKEKSQHYKLGENVEKRVAGEVPAALEKL
jgi:hypothetical protein